MIRTKKFYFLPFVDNLTAIGIALLMLLLFGDWIIYYAPVRAIAVFFMLFTLCGRIYVRMWNLSRKNIRYHYDLTKQNFIKFILPLVIFDLILIVFYCLCEHHIIPLDDIVVKSYYVFPDNAPREMVSTTLFTNYIAPVIKLWFLYLMFILKNGFVLLLAPILSFLSAVLGYKFGAEDKQIANFVANITEKAKNKFNE